MPPLPEAIIHGLAPFAPLFSNRVWVRPQLLLVGAMLSPGARTVTAALWVMGLATERRFANYHRVLNRATWAARQASQILLGMLISGLVPPGRRSRSGPTIPWSAIRDARSRPRTAFAMRCAAPRALACSGWR